MEQLNEFEGNIVVWIQDHLRVDALTPVVQWFTNLGNSGIIAIAVCVLLLLWKRYRNAGLVCSLSLALEFFVTNVFLKNLFSRTRPFVVKENLELITRAPKDYSFPSGHTGACFAVAMAMYLTMPKKYGIPALIFAVCMGLSRLYVGAHYPTDVLGGALCGILTAVIAKKIYEKRIVKSK